MMGVVRAFRHLSILAALALIVFSVAPARADSTFHTEQIPLMPVNGAPLHMGFVVDIHANGPVIYAQERYVLVGAEPNANYQVVTWLYGDPTCTTVLPGLPLPLPDAALNTNAAGNGEASLTLAPAVADGLRGSTVYIVWQVMMGGSVAYQTACVPVPLD